MRVWDSPNPIRSLYLYTVNPLPIGLLDSHSIERTIIVGRRADMTEDGMYKLKESDDYTRGFSDGIEAMLEIG